VAKFCRICSAPALEGSTLCAEHRAQAALFTRTVGADEPTPKPARSSTSTWSERSAFDTELTAAFERILAGAKARGAAEYRYPLVAVYSLNGKLRARAYHSVVPDGAKGAALAVDGPELARALGAGGSLREALARETAARQAELETGAVEVVSLELHTHADQAVLSETRGGSRREILRLTKRGSGFVEAR
jgi:hypothetical protein